MLRSELAQNARKKALEKFSIEQQTSNYIDIYHQILQAKTFEYYP
ncbi:hypothetical protein M23134_02041 [Microscilla marina ATCC 23134]|uniref:Uncharacterized protein n=1 Tax=Microscilla marina ATCC 23134 TaxID=313606 RepID=A1ZCL0_MICM2|nr:hypothetical protein M23134_02041 [Microscilla marina ATCC 23134]